MASSSDLTDAEFAELDDLLAQTPKPLTPVDAVMLDGYLCGVLVQPVLLTPEQWLPNLFDFDGEALPDTIDATWLARTRELVMRRHAALNRAIAEDGWFNPLVLEFDDEHPLQPPADDDEVDPMAELSEISQALMPWVAGFQHAALCFTELMDLPNEAVMNTLARLYRHLPAESREEREVVDTLDREFPLSTLEDAIEEMVICVADLYTLTEGERYKVDTVRRETPKVGRNDPCPCGSSKKFKLCHGTT